jgi:RimJ/RimL family protein N-acetyltransferase
MQEFTIRKATLQDIETLMQFEQGLITAERNFTDLLKPGPIRYYQLEEMLQHPMIDFVMAEKNGQPVACGYSRIEQSKSFYRTEKHAYLGMMFVVPEERGKGINALIIQSLMNMARERGITEICLEVFSRNHAALKAYKKLGFQEHILQMRMHVEPLS